MGVRAWKKDNSAFGQQDIIAPLGGHSQNAGPQNVQIAAFASSVECLGHAQIAGEERLRSWREVSEQCRKWVHLNDLQINAHQMYPKYEH
ncbi:MAG: hypothetical protein DHS20C04_29200 [Hyphococcus sp.]|nr:MAG: hypothetical protein DHS20C04_29200 [Marinicaulis sp.]